MTHKVLLQATTRAGGDLNPVVALALGMRTAGYAITVLCDPASEPIFHGSISRLSSRGRNMRWEIRSKRRSRRLKGRG